MTDHFVFSLELSIKPRYLTFNINIKPTPVELISKHIKNLVSQDIFQWKYIYK